MSKTWAPGALTAVALIVAAGVGGFAVGARQGAGDWPTRVYRACEQYAGLDLAGMASLCADAGYQERVYVQPTGTPAYWPHTGPTQPEDMGR